MMQMCSLLGCEAWTHQLHGLHQTCMDGHDWSEVIVPVLPMENGILILYSYLYCQMLMDYIVFSSLCRSGLVGPLPDACMFRVTEPL